MNVVRWGIVSAGKIASDFAKAISYTEGSEVAAIAARSISSAQKFASAHNIPKAYGSYDELLKDDDIDVIYVGSIANTHADVARKIILAKKPVVVEKPLSLTLNESASLIELAKESKVFLMEGLWTRCFPAMKKTSELIENGMIGDVICVQGDFGWRAKECPYPEDRFWDTKSGGTVYDIGMYLVHLGQLAYPNYKLQKVQAMGTMYNNVEITGLTNVQYQHPTDENKIGYVQFYCTGEANTEERVSIQGTKGRIVIHSPAHTPSSISLYREISRGSFEEERFHFPLTDYLKQMDQTNDWYYPGSIGFTYQIQDVCDAIKNHQLECKSFTHANSLELAYVIDEMLRQIRPSTTSSIHDEIMTVA